MFGITVIHSPVAAIERVGVFPSATCIAFELACLPNVMDGLRARGNRVAVLGSTEVESPTINKATVVAFEADVEEGRLCDMVAIQ